MKPLFILSLCICLVFSSCTMYTPKNIKYFKSLVADTSITHKKNDDLFISMEKAEELSLPYIINGADSFELRVWVSGVWTRRDLFVLRYTQNNWQAYNYSYYDTNGVLDSLQMNRVIIPDTTAAEIQARLVQDSVLSLPTQAAIPSFVDNTADGVTYHFEMATTRFYKAIQYHNPEYFQDKYNKQFLHILKYLAPRCRTYSPD